MIWIDNGPPVAEPVTRAEAKAQMRVERDDENEAIDTLIRAARETIEARTGLIVARRAFRLCLESPPQVHLALSRGPARAVLAARIFGEDGTPQMVDANDVRIVAGGRALMLPKALAERSGQEVEIELDMGLDAADVPDMLRLAMLHLVGVSYETRGAAPATLQPAFLPPLVRGLLAPYRRVGL